MQNNAEIELSNQQQEDQKSTTSNSGPEDMSEGNSSALEDKKFGSQSTAAGSEIGSEKPAKKDSRWKAILFMNFFALFAIAQGSIWKLVEDEGVHILDYQFLRNAVIVVIEIPLLLFLRENPLKSFPAETGEGANKKGKSKLKWALLLVSRSLAGHICFVLLNLSFVFAPLFLCIIIFQTNPFWIAMLGQCINSEKVQRMEYIGMSLCFVGVCGIGISTVLKKDNSPELVEESESESNFDNFIILGMVLVFAAAWSFSVNCVLNRTLKEISFSVVMFYHGLIGVLLTMLAISSDMYVNGSEFRLAQYPSHIFWLTVFSGLLDGLRGYCMTIAFQSDSSGFVSLFGYINVAYAFAADVFIFKETFGIV